MSKQKSKFIGFLLAVFTGPLSFIYVGKWKKAMVLFALIWVPFINAAVYIYTIFAIISNVKRYNREGYDNVHFGILACSCKSQNRKGSKFCSNCGSKLVRICEECNQMVGKNEKYCNNCGNAFIKRRLSIRKYLSFA